ncbi:MAG: hypothetical protein DMG05_08715 [Acidobacteria bacterium]|nr:MAG: hypothetical protein DMG05_08715 [Acidobacteriota bacterium]
MKSALKQDPVGICRGCIHSKIITSSKGGIFYYCRLSESNPQFAKYPRLPVYRCPGFQKAISKTE